MDIKITAKHCTNITFDSSSSHLIGALQLLTSIYITFLYDFDCGQWGALYLEHVASSIENI